MREEVWAWDNSLWKYVFTKVNCKGMKEQNTRARSQVMAAAQPLTGQPAVYLSGLTPSSRRTMHKALNVIARLLSGGECDALTIDWALLRYQHTAAIRSVLMERYAPATANRMLCALRRTLKEAQRLGLMSADDYARAVDIRTVRGDSPLRGRVLKPSEMAALFRACKHELSPAGTRDAALIAILAGAGLRRSEAVALCVSDFEAETGALQVHKGKGGKSRTVYLPDAAVSVVMAWLAARGSEKGSLLCPVLRGGHTVIRQMTDQAVMLIVEKRATQAGIAALSPHDFRRTFITNLLENGADLLTVQSLAGHANPSTTSRYDRRGEAAKRQAVQLLNIPFDG